MLDSLSVVRLRAAGARPGELRELLASSLSMGDLLALTPLERMGMSLPQVSPDDSFTLPEGVWVMTLQDEDFPSHLRDAPATPPFLLGRGSRSALSLGVGVVGTREVSKMGSLAARLGVEGARDLGVPVHSGMARGVDFLAHRHALDLGLVTCAVLGSGPERLTPSSSAELGREILERGGAVVTEQLPGVPPTGPTLQARNRLVAALSSVVVVCEASLGSGTIGTVRSALQMGRRLVVPDVRESGRHLPGAEALLVLLDPVNFGGRSLGLSRALSRSLEGSLPLATPASSTDLSATVVRLHGEFVSSSSPSLSQPSPDVLF